MPHVLIAFADPSQTEVPAIVCDDAGYTYDFATELEAGDHVLARPYDLVLMVSAHPLPLARAIHAAAPQVPLVAIAGDAAVDGHAALREQGVREVIARPYSIQALRRALAEAVRTRWDGGARLFTHRP